jgi:CBS domain-containing protein
MRKIRISDILHKKDSIVHTIHPDFTVLDAASKLVDKAVGALVVLDDNGDIAGILTERDILRESARSSEHLGTTQILDIMTPTVVLGNPDQTVEEVMFLMTQMCIRHLPVVRNGNLVGMISIGDAVKAQLEQAGHEIRHLHNYIAGVYPA